jgi:hypothetical protein
MSPITPTSIKLKPEEIQRLTQIAADFGLTATRSQRTGKPSWRVLVHAIASGKIQCTLHPQAHVEQMVVAYPRQDLDGSVVHADRDYDSDASAAKFCQMLQEALARHYPFAEILASTEDLPRPTIQINGQEDHPEHSTVSGILMTIHASDDWLVEQQADGTE